MLLGEEVLQPPVLHLELSHASFKRGVLLGSLSDGTLENLLALLLLHAEASTGGGVPPASVFFGGHPDRLLLTQGCGDAFTGNRSAVLAVAHLPVGRGDGR